MAPDRNPYSGLYGGGILATLCLLLLFGCATLPPLGPTPSATMAPLPFPRGRWQLVHRIEARFPGNHKALMMGALELDSATGHLTCALMTVEGFTLFSASQTDRLQVTRAVPPFDGPGFADGLMADLRLLFLVPSDARLQAGSLDGRPAHRYLHAEGHTTDVIASAIDRYRIARYAADGRLVRRARLIMRASPGAGQEMAREILLEARDEAGYTLRLDLIEALPLGDANPTNANANANVPEDSP